MLHYQRRRTRGARTRSLSGKSHDGSIKPSRETVKHQGLFSRTKFHKPLHPDQAPGTLLEGGRRSEFPQPERRRMKLSWLLNRVAGAECHDGTSLTGHGHCLVSLGSGLDLPVLVIRGYCQATWPERVCDKTEVAHVGHIPLSPAIHQFGGYC